MTRLVIRGEVQGYPVEVHVNDSDLALDDDGNWEGPLSDVKVGLIQSIISEIQDHGVLPLTRQRSESSTTNSETMASEKKSKSSVWECPEHGSQYVYPASRGEGKQCSKWQAVDEDFEDFPSWSQKKVADVRGEYRIYCKHREFPYSPGKR